MNNHPIKPSIMSKAISDLTMDEIRSLPEVVRLYDEAVEEWKIKRLAHNRIVLDEVRSTVDGDMTVDHIWGDAVWQWTLSQFDLGHSMTLYEDTLRELKMTYENNVMVAKIASGYA